MNNTQLTDWSHQLAAKLNNINLQYQAFLAIKNGEVDAAVFQNDEVLNTDPQANATLVMASALAAVVSALARLPAFADKEGLTVLHDLMAALATVDRGGLPDLFKPRPDADGKKRHVDRDYVEQHAVLCVDLLASLPNVSRTSARKTVAQIFSDAGHKGRKKVAGLLPQLSAKSIFEWETKLRDGAPRSARREWVAGQMLTYRSRADWPPTRNELVAEIKRIASHPLLKTKI